MSTDTIGNKWEGGSQNEGYHFGVPNIRVIICLSLLWGHSIYWGYQVYRLQHLNNYPYLL